MHKRLVFLLGCALLAGGAIAFGWYWYLQTTMTRVQRAASAQLDRQIEQQKTASPLVRATVIVPPRTGEPVGRIEIPRLHVSVMILEGTSGKTLRVAAGHIKGTALPDVDGNIGIAAHRDTFFRPLREVKPHDDIVLTTSHGAFRYLVDSVEIVDPTQVGVLHATKDPELTLVTCYPFSYFGSAPKRFIVHARQQG